MDNLPAEIKEKGLPVVKTNSDLNAMVHDVFKPDKFNVLVPKFMSFGPAVKIAIQMVELDSNIDPQKKRSKDFWTIDGKDYILSANAIRKLSGAADIRWVTAECGIDGEPAYDPKTGQINRIRYKAVCIVITSLCTIKNGIGIYEYNYANDLQDHRFREKEKKNGKWVATNKIKWGQVNQRRQFAVQLVESGAKARAIYDALGIIEKSYSKADISKPFIVPCVIDDLDYSDPVIKRMVAERALGAQRDVYGGGEKAVNAEHSIKTITEQNNKHNQDQPAIDDPESDEELPPPEETQEEQSEDSPTPDEIRAAYQKDWEDTTGDERARHIRKLAKEINYDITQLKGKRLAPPEKWGLKIQIQWIMFLATQAGKIPKPEGALNV